MDSTQQIILNSAIKIFQTKGFAGTRMQEIANDAGINKAMLHYYYRSKQQLFEVVFKNAFQQIAPQVHQILNSNESISTKMEQFVNFYIDFISENRYLPVFVLQELNTNPNFFQDYFLDKHLPETTIFIKQIQTEVGSKINPEQLLIDMFSLCVFPFVGMPLLKIFLKKSDNEYTILLKERKNHIIQLLHQQIQQ